VVERPHAHESARAWRHGKRNASVSREYNIDYGFLWSLRYRRDRLRIISVSVYETIRAAYRAECERQLRKLENELKRTEEIAGANSNAVRAAKALLGKD
jgi:hypothetical protein